MINAAQIRIPDHHAIVEVNDRQREPYAYPRAEVDNHLEPTPPLSVRIITPVTHWSPKVAAFAAAVSGITTALGVALWAIPQFNSLSSYFFYFAVPTGGLSLGTHIMSSCYLNRFIPQRALEEQIQIAEGTTITAEQIVIRLRDQEALLEERVEDIQRLTREKQEIIESMQFNQERLEQEIQAFSVQNQALQEKIELLNVQINSLRSLKIDITHKFEWVRRENQLLVHNMTKINGLIESLQSSLRQFRRGKGTPLETAQEGQERELSIEEQLNESLQMQLSMKNSLESLYQFINEENQGLMATIGRFEQTRLETERGVSSFIDEHKQYRETLEKFEQITNSFRQFAGSLVSYQRDFYALVGKLSQNEQSIKDLLIHQQEVTLERERTMNTFQTQISSLREIWVNMQVENDQLKALLELQRAREVELLVEMQHLRESIEARHVPIGQFIQDKDSYMIQVKHFEAIIDRYEKATKELQKLLEITKK